MKIKVTEATDSHLEAIEKIHLKHFGEIGQISGDVADYSKRKENLGLVALDEDDKVVGYIIAATYGKRSWLEWFGVEIEGAGVAQLLLDKYFEEMKKQNVSESLLVSRNRFKKAIAFYLKNDFDIHGVYLGSDNDLMINLRKKI